MTGMAETDGTNLPTVCVLCSHNCGIRVDVKDNRIVAVRGDETNPISKGYLCNKAFSIQHYVEHGDRVPYPMRRRPDGTFEEIDWDTAITEIAAKLDAVRRTHSPRSIALVGIGGQGNHMDAPYGLGFLRGLGSKRWFNAFAQEKTQHFLIDQWMFDAPPSVFFHPDVEHTNFWFGMAPEQLEAPLLTLSKFVVQSDATVPSGTDSSVGSDSIWRPAVKSTVSMNVFVRVPTNRRVTM